MEVDGNLKVTGTVDASGNPITNVGAALSMTDAINGNVLQSALRDDNQYEYKYFKIFIPTAYNKTTIYYVEMDGSNELSSSWTQYLNNMILAGWTLYNQELASINQLFINNSIGDTTYFIVILRRKVSDD